MKIIRTTRDSLAFTVLELLVVVAIIAVLAALLLPGVNREKVNAERITCVSYQKNIGLAFRIWSVDNHDLFPMQFYTNVDGSPKFADATNLFRYFQVMSNELNTAQLLACPRDKERSAAKGFGAAFGNSNVSYFIGVDADETRPAMLLAGDRNVTNGAPLKNGMLTLTTNEPVGWTMEMHQGNGNVALADGSVQQLSTSRLRDAVRFSGTNANRLLMPWTARSP
jgi:prepilin-type processing-associated H-X9-DG protein